MHTNDVTNFNLQFPNKYYYQLIMHATYRDLLILKELYKH